MVIISVFAIFLFNDLFISSLIILVAALGIIGSIWALFLAKIKLNVERYTCVKMIVGIIGEYIVFTINQFLATHGAASNIEQSIKCQ